MLFLRCPYCHKLVFRFFFSRHKAKHTAQRPDGQQNEYVTLHPSGRYEGSLAGVPQCYRHPKCGVVTRMPEEIIRSYLVNPFLYGAGSFCCGCGAHIPEEELFWDETGQNMAEYTRELREVYIQKYGAPPPPVQGY
jgi:hypothetical protein